MSGWSRSGFKCGKNHCPGNARTAGDRHDRFADLSPEIVKQFNAQAPDVDVVLKEMSNADQINELLRGQIHAGFINASTVPPQLASLPMAED